MSDRPLYVYISQKGWLSEQDRDAAFRAALCHIHNEHVNDKISRLPLELEVKHIKDLICKSASGALPMVMLFFSSREKIPSPDTFTGFPPCSLRLFTICESGTVYFQRGEDIPEVQGQGCEDLVSHPEPNWEDTEEYPVAEVGVGV